MIWPLHRQCSVTSEHFNAQCFASTTSSSSHWPFLPRSELPWPGRFFPTFLSFPCHSSISLFLYLLLFLSPSPRLPLSLPLSFFLSVPLPVTLWPSLFPLLNSLSVIRRDLESWIVSLSSWQCGSKPGSFKEQLGLLSFARKTFVKLT